MTEWRVPRPFEVLGGLFLVAEAMREADFFPHGSVGDRVVGLFLTFCAMTGIAAARAYLSPQVRAKLEYVDNQVMKEKNGHG